MVMPPLSFSRRHHEPGRHKSPCVGSPITTAFTCAAALASCPCWASAPPWDPLHSTAITHAREPSFNHPKEVVRPKPRKRPHLDFLTAQRPPHLQGDVSVGDVEPSSGMPLLRYPECRRESERYPEILGLHRTAIILGVFAIFRQFQRPWGVGLECRDVLEAPPVLGQRV